MALLNLTGEKYKGIKYLQPLFRLAYLMGLSPICGLRQNNYAIKSFYRFYAVFAMGLIFAGSVGGSLIGRISEVFPLVPVSLIIVDTISIMTLTTTNLWYIYNASVRYRKDFVKIFRGFTHVGKVFQTVANERRKILKFYVEFNLAHVCLALYYTYDSYFWLVGTARLTWREYVFWTIQDYLIFIMTLLYRYYVVELKSRFETLNKFIVDDATRVFETKKGGGAPHDIKGLSKVYTILCEQINLGNDVFGYPILFLSLYFVSELLRSLLFLIVYYMNRKAQDGGDEFGMNVSAFCLIWCLKNMVLFLFVISPCDDATSEAKQTSIICYKLLQELPNVNSIFQDKSMRDDLVLLAIQSSTRYPTFSAAGFFTVDYTMLFTLLGSITSYLVVLIQFN